MCTLLTLTTGHSFYPNYPINALSNKRAQEYLYGIDRFCASLFPNLIFPRLGRFPLWVLFPDRFPFRAKVDLLECLFSFSFLSLFRALLVLADPGTCLFFR